MKSHNPLGNNYPNVLRALEKAIAMLQDADHIIASGELVPTAPSPKEILKEIESLLLGEKK